MVGVCVGKKISMTGGHFYNNGFVLHFFENVSKCVAKGRRLHLEVLISAYIMVEVM